MDSNFKGIWQYARHTAKGSGVVQSPATVMIEDNAGNDPQTVTFTDSKGSAIALVVDTLSPHDISFKKDSSHRGRLVILSAGTPALLVGSIAKGTFPESEAEARDPGGDSDIDVFIAVKVG
jgi:hypothetical protein